MAVQTMQARPMPGPRGLPVVGKGVNLLRVMRDPFRWLRRLHTTYGDVVALARGDRSMVFAFGPEHNHALLAQPDLFVNDRRQLLRIPPGTALHRLFTSNLSTMDGAHHRQQRRLMQPAFHRKQVHDYCADMAAITQQTLERWQPHRTLDLHSEMQRLTQHITVATLFGVYDEEELAQVGGLFQRSTAIVASPLALTLPYNIPGLPFHRANRMIERLEHYILSVIERKRRQPEASDVLAALVRARDEDGAALSEQELVSHAFTLFAAGHETTANALTWTVALLDQHPQVYADLLDELDDALGGAAPSAAQLAGLPLLEGVVKESLRLLPPAIVGIRTAAAETQLGSYVLPKDANVFYSEFITHRLPELYEQPDRFLPERWRTLERGTYEYLPFAAGPHMCIGWGFALQELKVVLALLVQRFRLALMPGISLTPGFNMRPQQGMPVQVHPQDRRFQRTPVRGQIRELVALA
ncbi:MAG: cytochrome P450 [Roseiflexaceae bacterium]